MRSERSERLETTTHTLAGPLGSGACQPRHSASIRKPKQIATPGSATTHSGWPHPCASTDDTVYFAVHVNEHSDHRDYFNAVEALMRSHGGRPHWGKLHSRTAEDLADAYPRWQDFQVMRDRLDPGRVFTNPYLDRVLG